MLSKLKSGLQVTSGLEVVLKQEESHKVNWQGMVTGHPHLERGWDMGWVPVWGTGEFSPLLPHVTQLTRCLPPQTTLPSGQARCLELGWWASQVKLLTDKTHSVQV